MSTRTCVHEIRGGACCGLGSGSRAREVGEGKDPTPPKNSPSWPAQRPSQSAWPRQESVLVVDSALHERGRFREAAGDCDLEAFRRERLIPASGKSASGAPKCRSAATLSGRMQDGEKMAARQPLPLDTPGGCGYERGRNSPLSVSRPSTWPSSITSVPAVEAQLIAIDPLAHARETHEPLELQHGSTSSRSAAGSPRSSRSRRRQAGRAPATCSCCARRGVVG